MTDASTDDTKPNRAGRNGAAPSGDQDPGAGAAPQMSGQPELDPAVAERIASVRSKLRESFGSVVMSMLMLPRYRHQTVADLQHLVLEPLVRNRIVIAYPATSDNALSDLTGIAVWANVSDEVDAKIREQIRSGTFPIRLAPDDWTSGATAARATEGATMEAGTTKVSATEVGTTNWLLDVIAPDRKAVRSLIANFNKVVEAGPLVLHPVVARQIDREDLERLGATRMGPDPETST